MEKENEISEEKKVESQEIQKENQEEVKSEVELEKEDKQIESEKLEENKKDKTEVVDNQSKALQEDSKKSNKIIFIILSIIVIIAIFFSTIFAIININNDEVLKGVFIEQLEIGNIKKEDVNNLVAEKLSKITDISIKDREYNDVIKFEDLGIQIDANDAVQKGISFGKTNNIIVDNYQILYASIFGKHFELSINIDEEKFSEMVKKIQVEVPGAIEEYSYEIKDDELIITNGKAGKAINSEEFKRLVIENIKEQFNTENKELEIEIPTIESNPEKIDIEKIYNEIYKEAKDAYIVEEPFELHKEENGIDFNITIEEAKQMLQEEKETYTIPLKITKPKIKVKDLGDKLFKQTLAKYTTIYDAGNANRSHNVYLAAKTINGTILLPGETFSYNGKLGNTNAAKGYKQASAYAGGKVIQSYGGGICQVSSTLYNAVLYANLEIVERYNHSYAVSYVPAGRDATVAYGGKDFKFKNSRTYPIKIVSSAKNGIVSISIVGIEEEKEYEVVLTSTVLSTKANSTTYENNSNLEEGKEKVIQKGYVGKTSIAYKILKYNGKTISKTVLSKDTYKPMNRIVQVGTKKTVETTTMPTEPTVTQPEISPGVPPTSTESSTITNDVNI